MTALTFKDNLDAIIFLVIFNRLRLSRSLGF